MPTPVVSVTICMHNASRYICETLDSVFAQTLQDFEIIVVDDGSTDGSSELVEGRYRDRRLSILRQQQQTLRIARPVSLAQAKGTYFAILDSDDVWAPTKLERQVAAACAAPHTGLVFSDCELIDPNGATIGRLSDQFDFERIDLSAGQAHLELLRRGNFVSISTAFAPVAAVRRLGGFNYSYQYVNDYDLWLRLARCHTLTFIPDPLAKYRIHETQFTQRHADITLSEQSLLLEHMRKSASYPRDVRIAIGDNLLGQHRLAWRVLARQGRYRSAARAAIGIARYRDRVWASLRHQVRGRLTGRVLESSIAAANRGRDAAARAHAQAANATTRVAVRARRAPRRIGRLLRGQSRPAGPPNRDAQTAPIQVWLDGSSLGREQAGYFSLLSELIRTLVRQESPVCEVHVTAQQSGRAALRARLGPDVSPVRFHALGWRAFHWTQIHLLICGWPVQLAMALMSAGLLGAGISNERPGVISVAAAAILLQVAILLDELGARAAAALGRPRHQYAARAIRFLWRRLPAPRSGGPAANVVEILFWRGRFRWRHSKRVAIVQDLTTRVHPELHTEGNVTEFEEFLGYVQRHAQLILTVSENSRRDIVERVGISPGSVSVIPMPIHPQYHEPQFKAGIPALHGISGPYVLCVGAIEPRKNLRRLVRAFELLKHEPVLSGMVLVIVGPQAWDNGFREFLNGTDLAHRVRMLGFIPLEQLPSLYHFSSAVVCPSVYEGFGIPVMEAMCSSAAVLASDISSLPEVLGPGGIRFDPYEPEAIAAALLSVLTMSPDEAANYRKRGRQHALAHLARVANTDLLSGTPVSSLVEVS